MKCAAKLVFVVMSAVGYVKMAEAAPEYTVIDLGLKMRPVAINARGEIAATRYGAAETYEAMIWSNGAWHSLSNPADGSSVAEGINDKGDVVGRVTTRSPNSRRPESHGFLWIKGSATDLGISDASLTLAVAINDAGIIVGEDDHQNAWRYDGKTRISLGTLLAAGTERTMGESVFSDGHREPFKTSSEGYVKPVAINAAGEIVGQAAVVGENGRQRAHAFFFSHEKLTDLGTLGGDYSGAAGISDRGWIVGGSGLRKSEERHAFLYRDGRMEDLGVPGGFESSTAMGINAHGVIVGDASSVKGGGFLYIVTDSRAYRWQNGAWIDLNTLVDLSGTAFQRVHGAKAINDAGQIIGEAMAKDGWHGVLLTPIAAH